MTNSLIVTADMLRGFEPISSLSDTQINDLIQHAKITRLGAGERLFSENGHDNSFLYLINGQVVLTSKSDATKLEITSDTKLARHPLSDKQPYTHTAHTQTECDILRVEKDLLDMLLAWGHLSVPDTEVIMKSDGIFTINKGDWLKKMYVSPIFKNLPPSNIEMLLDRLEPINVSAGEVIIKQGDSGDFFYMVDEGCAEVIQLSEDGKEIINSVILQAGSSFGEAALISDKPRNATITMQSSGVLLRLSKDQFTQLLQEPNLLKVDYESACQKANNGAIWLDVRLKSEYTHSHLPDAINIPMHMLYKEIRHLDKTTTYICHPGRRASAAAFILNQHNISSCVLKDELHDLPSDSMTTNG